MRISFILQYLDETLTMIALDDNLSILDTASYSTLLLQKFGESIDIIV